jgi:hypothetical protein
VEERYLVSQSQPQDFNAIALHLAIPSPQTIRQYKMIPLDEELGSCHKHNPVGDKHEVKHVAGLPRTST